MGAKSCRRTAGRAAFIMGQCGLRTVHQAERLLHGIGVEACHQVDIVLAVRESAGVADGAGPEEERVVDSAAHAHLLPGQTPTSTGYEAWRTARGGGSTSLSLYAASRAAYLPAQPGHASHAAQVAWFPGGTVTPVASLSIS